MEWKKILVNRKLIGLIAVLFMLQMIVFWRDCRQHDRLWIEKYNQNYDEYLQEEQQQYMDAFHDRIVEIIDQAEKLKGISIFSSEGSFSKRNLELTKEAFEPLLDIKLSYVKGRTLTEFFSFQFGSLCVFLCGIAIAFELSEIRKKSMRSITFTTQHGKLRMAVEKAGALFLWAFMVTFLFQSGIILEGVWLFGENLYQILVSPAQTFAVLSNFTLELTIWQTLLLYLFYRTVILYVIMLLMWAMALFFDHVVLTMGVLGVFIGAECFLYAFIDDNNVWKLLKYCNIWYQMAESSYFTNYKNLNIVGYAINRNVAILAALFSAFLFSVGLGTYLCCRCYPYRSKERRINRTINFIGIKIEKIKGLLLERLSLSGMELYKTLIVQKSLVAVVLLGLLLFYKADFTSVQRSTQQELYYEFMDNYLGEPGEDAYNAIAQFSDKLEQVDQSFNEKLADEALDADTKIELSLWYDSFAEERLFLEQIREQTENLEKILQERGIAVWYVNLYSYNHLLHNDDVMLNLGILIAVLWISIGIYLEEKRSKMGGIINSSYRKSLLYKTKLKLAVILTSLIFFMVLIYEILLVAAVYGLKGAGAPVQSILELSYIRGNFTIWQYFLVRYAVKYLCFLLLCVIVCKGLELIICKKGLTNGIENRKSV